MVNKIKSSLTIDLGTTNTKVTLWDNYGPHLRKFQTPKIVHDEYTDFDVEKLWNSIVKTIRKFKINSLKQVENISIASFGESGVLLDSVNHQRVSECIAWFDERAQTIVDSISEQDKKKIYSITGLPVHSHYSACKIAWLLRNNKSLSITSPSYHDYLWLGVPDYLVYKLTGRFGTEYSLASRSLCLNLQTKTWSNTVKKILHIENVNFPKLYKAGEGIGYISGNLKNLFSPNCVASIAGHDHMVGSNSAKLDENQLLDSTGTTEALMCLVDHPDFSKEAEKCALANGIYTDGQHYTRFTAMPSAGSTVEWFMKVFGLDENQFMDLQKQALFQYKNGTLLNSKALLFPHFNGSGAPYKFTQSQGMIYGINRSTNKIELIFGLFLGLTFEFAVAYENLFNQVSISQIKVIGPAIKDPLWSQLKADLLRLPVNNIDIDQAVSAGAIILGSNASINAKIGKYIPTKNEKQIKYLKRQFKLYKQIYSFLRNNSL